MLDTYEQTGLFIDDWLRSLLDSRYGELTPNFLLVIAGRDSLNRNNWVDMDDWIVRSELEPFTQDETRQYLVNKGITDKTVIQEIWRLSSGGLPLLIGMMAQAAPISLDSLTDVCEDAVERFLKWELDGNKRQLALNAALPRILNRDILALLVDEVAVNDLFEWLKGRSFVVEHPEGWQYHNIVREQMLRYQQRISPTAWKKQHTQLAEYYDKLRKSLGLADALQQQDETWQKYTLEWLYHSLCKSPLHLIGMALNGWLIALETTQKFALEWAEAMKMAGNATNSQDMKRWSQQFQNALKSFNENRWSDMDVVLSALLKESVLEDKCRAIALASKGMFPLVCIMTPYVKSQVKWKTEEVPDLDPIIEVLTQAVSLAPNKGEYLVYRGIVYLCRGDVDEANSDFNQCLQINGIDNKLKISIEAFNDGFQQIKSLKELFSNHSCEQFNFFKSIPELEHKLEEEHEKNQKEIQLLKENIKFQNQKFNG